MAALSRRAARPLLICLLLAQRGCHAHAEKQQPSTLLGSYPHVLQNSLRNLSSEADVAATVATWKATGQTLGGGVMGATKRFQVQRAAEIESEKQAHKSVLGVSRVVTGAGGDHGIAKI
eukprot:COSAG01_NODE_9727_length_2360_cov_1.546861_2_plen_119_part_00